MGSGIEELEEVAADLEDKYPGNFRAVLSFKGAEKYKTYAAADFALMPSRFVGDIRCSWEMLSATAPYGIHTIAL